MDKLETSAEAVLRQLSAVDRARYADAYRTAVARAVARTRAGSAPEVVARAVLRALAMRCRREGWTCGLR